MQPFRLKSQAVFLRAQKSASFFSRPQSFMVGHLGQWHFSRFSLVSSIFAMILLNDDLAVHCRVDGAGIIICARGRKGKRIGLALR